MDFLELLIEFIFEFFRLVWRMIRGIFGWVFSLRPRRRNGSRRPQRMGATTGSVSSDARMAPRGRRSTERLDPELDAPPRPTGAHRVAESVTLSPSDAPARTLSWDDRALVFRGEPRSSEHLRITREEDGSVVLMRSEGDLAWLVANPEAVRTGEVYPGVRSDLSNEPELSHDVRAIWSIPYEDGQARLMVGTKRSTLVWSRRDGEEAFLFGSVQDRRRVLVRRALDSEVLLDHTLPAPGADSTTVKWVGQMNRGEAMMLHLAAVLVAEAFASTPHGAAESGNRSGAA